MSGGKAGFVSKKFQTLEPLDLNPVESAFDQGEIYDSDSDHSMSPGEPRQNPPRDAKAAARIRLRDQAEDALTPGNVLFPSRSASVSSQMVESNFPLEFGGQMQFSEGRSNVREELALDMDDSKTSEPAGNATAFRSMSRATEDLRGQRIPVVADGDIIDYTGEAHVTESLNQLFDALLDATLVTDIQNTKIV